jgi:hypothetical protein
MNNTEASLTKIWNTEASLTSVWNDTSTSSAEIARAFVLAFRVLPLTMAEEGNNSWLANGTPHCKVRIDFSDIATGKLLKTLVRVENGRMGHLGPKYFVNCQTSCISSVGKYNV